MMRGVSLANKCQLLFGFSVVAIITCILIVAWVRTQSLVRESQIEHARQLADAWLQDRIQLGQIEPRRSASVDVHDEDASPDGSQEPALRVQFVPISQIEQQGEQPGFLQQAMQYFNDRPDAEEYSMTGIVDDRPLYRYAKPIRELQYRTLRNRSVSPSFDTTMLDPNVANPLRALLVVEGASRFAAGQLLTSQIFLIATGLVASMLAILVFYLILTKLIFSPVRTLRATAEKVQSGDLSIRANLQTGDEFQQLSDAFNAMLERVQKTQLQLESMNESLDLKVNELAEVNVGLFESNRFKSEFLANVSHELRTPLNSIIGFTELLDEMARSDANADPKRVRYLNNILSSGRSLLEMINELLDMAKIEAGRMEAVIEPTSVVDLVEGIAAIMRPQAEAKRITLETRVGRNVPVVETDPGKLQQILYNFLSNAIKFTPPGMSVMIAADRITHKDNQLGVRLSVADTGPGIPPDMQDIIFEKFRQVDASHTREHPGTGLGLAICMELAKMIGAEISFVSKPGHGATFFVDLPLIHRPDEPLPLMASHEANSAQMP